jgi:hypothetical protein
VKKGTVTGWVGAFLTKKYPKRSAICGEKCNLQSLGEVVKKCIVTGWVGAFLTEKYPETSVSRGEKKKLQ